MLTLLLTASALAGECPEPATPRQLAAATEEALLAFAAMDEGAFQSRRAHAEALVPCLSGRIDTEDAAGFHRMQALDHFMDGEDESTVAALHAVLLLDDGFRLPASLAPEGGRLQRLHEQARQALPTRRERLAAPADLVVFVNGERSSTRPLGVPLLVQGLDDDEVLVSAWIAADGPLPEWPAVDSPEPLDVSGSLSGSRARSPRPLAWAALGTGVLAAGLYGAAGGTRIAYDQDPSPGKRKLVNGAYIGSVGLGLVSLGLGGAALVDGGAR